MRRWAWLGAPALLLALACSCDTQSTFNACLVNPTFQDERGEWREADGEPLDDDPCDSDDYTEDGRLKPGKVRTPAVKQPMRPPAGPGVPNQPRPRRGY